MKAGWRTIPFEEVVASRGSGSQGLPQSEWLDSGTFPVIGQGAGDIEGWSDRSDLVVRPSPAVVLYGGHTRRAKHVTQPFVPGPNVKILEPRSSLESGFLFYFLSWLPIESKGYADHFPLVRKASIPVPPAADQRRIIALLDEAFDGISAAKANAEKNLQNARAIFDSHLDAVFTRRGEAWDRLTLEVLLERGWILGHLDGNHGSDYPRKEEFIDRGIPYISANCLDRDSVHMSRAKYLSPERATKLRKGIARNGDVLFAHNATVGPVAILRTDEPKVILGTSLTYYRCNQDRVLPAYLAHYMRSLVFRQQYLQVMKQSTRNQVLITKQREFFHVIPPLTDQLTVIRELDGLLDAGQRLEVIYQQKLDALGELKKSLLHQAFSGAL